MLLSNGLSGNNRANEHTLRNSLKPHIRENLANYEVEQISDNAFWNACENSIRSTLEGFEAHGITLPTQDYIFTVILNDPQNPMSAIAAKSNH